MTDNKIEWMQRAHSARSHYKKMIKNHIGDSLDGMVNDIQRDFFDSFERSMDIVDVDVVLEIIKDKLTCQFDEVC